MFSHAPVLARTALLLALALALALPAVGCASDGKDPIKEYDDEDLERNPVKRETLLHFGEVPGVNMRLPAGWHLPEKAKTDRWIFEATPYAGEPAYLRLDIQYDEKYQFRDPEILHKHRVEMEAWQASADQYGSDSFKVLSANMIGVQPVGTRDLIPGWALIYVDREDPKANTGPLRVRMVAKLWEKGRAFNFFMATTMSGYEQIFGDMFVKLLKSFRSTRALGMDE